MFFSIHAIPYIITLYTCWLSYFRKYDVRISPNFAAVVEQYCDAEVREVVDDFRSSIHRRYVMIIGSVRGEISVMVGVLQMTNCTIVLGLMVHFG